MTAKATHLHSLVERFPKMQPDQFRAFVEDIRRNGQHQAVTVTEDGAVIDGRHRFIACEELGVECKAELWDGTGDPLSFIISANAQRRHLSTSQRACILARTSDCEPIVRLVRQP